MNEPLIANGIQIFIVEDSQTQALQLKHILETNHFHVFVAENGLEALKLLRQHKPTVIISDVMMPQMDGYELCRRIKENKELKEIPVMLLTTLSDTKDVIKALECGADNFITKPYNEIDLLSQIKNILENHEPRNRESMQKGVEILFGGQKYFITSERHQILNLLLSSYETAVKQNIKLIKAQDELRRFNEQLEEKVKERTAALEAEIAERKRTEEALQKAHDELEIRVKERTSELKAANVSLEREIVLRGLVQKELVLARQSAEAASRAKSDFLASMSHELRTPLNAIIGFSEILRDRYFGELNEKQTDYVNDVLESGKHLLSLINDILDLSKIEAGKIELQLSRVNVKEVLENSLRMVSEKCMKHGIDLGMNIGAGQETLEITADERRLKQVIFNLLSNAAKFTPDGGAILVEAEQKGKMISISVKDTGIGISLEDQEKIFEEFYQVKGTIVDKTPGTGLGLPVSRRLVEMHGGELWVESEGEGKGSKFSLALPLVAKPSEERGMPEIPDSKVLRNHLVRTISLSKRKGRGFAFCCLQVQGEASKENLFDIKRVLQKQKRAYDFLGMDERGGFCLIVQESNPQESHAICERTMKVLEGMNMGVQMSYAVAIYPGDGNTPEELMKKVQMSAG